MAKYVNSLSYRSGNLVQLDTCNYARPMRPSMSRRMGQRRSAGRVRLMLADTKSFLA
jgi:hypothetical protein